MIVIRAHTCFLVTLTLTLVSSFLFSSVPLEKFDDLCTGDPSVIERNLKELLPQAKQQEDQSIYLQILSQIALAQALQHKFPEAHNTIDLAEKNLTPSYSLAKVRILLEKGRILYQEGQREKAYTLFKSSYDLSSQYNFDYHTINAAHMLAMASPSLNESLAWNQKALAISQSSKNPDVSSWTGALYNNLGNDYLDNGELEKGYDAYQKCILEGNKNKDPLLVLNGRWGCGKALRMMKKLEEALAIQLTLLEDYAHAIQNNNLQIDLLETGRGFVYEELGEIYLQKASFSFQHAYEDLSKDPWMQTLYPERLERIRSFVHQE